MTKRVVVLGSTGSVGEQALEVIADAAGSEHPLKLVGLAAATSWQKTLAQASSFGCRDVFISNCDVAQRARDAASATEGAIQVAESVGELLDRAEPDIVLNAIVGFAGLEATIAVLERGIDLAIANKESLVAAGQLCMKLAHKHNAAIIPVDSEHSALQQCFADSVPEEITSLVLTASGGPFRGKSAKDLKNVNVDEALNHPTWSMGGKISIDSATLMNKGLELIEAMMLFDVPEEAVEVVIHPHSIVHSLVRHRDGSLLAHLGWPDMRVPIAWALHYPVRAYVGQARHLDLVDMPALTFEAPDLETFRCLALARDAARAGGSAPCVLNAANEMAVAAFMEKRIGFLDITSVIEAVLGGMSDDQTPDSLAAAAAFDQRARELSVSIINRINTISSKHSGMI